MTIEFIAPVVALVAFVGKELSDFFSEKETRQQIKRSDERASEQPEKLKPAWEAARLRLESYFDGNLKQVNAIFYLGVAVMIVGFLFVLYGINRSLNDSRAVPISLVAAAAGIVTEFIGATFMLIYRSTLQQASSYMSILERINSVGMAVQILDSIIGNETEDLKNATRAELVRILLAPPRSRTVNTQSSSGNTRRRNRTSGTTA